MDHLADEQLVDLALSETTGEHPDPAHADHARTCPVCSTELAAYRHVIGLAHEARAEHEDRHSPLPGGWAGIAQELGFAEVPAARIDPPEPAAPNPRRRLSRRTAGWLTAAVLAVLAAIAGGILIGRATVTVPTGPMSASSATLAPLAGDPAASAGSTGEATMTNGAQGPTLTVNTDRLPLRQGFYQVWLYDQAANLMVPIGTLNASGAGTFTVSPSIDVRAYDIVDVSAQDLNGNPAHGTSVLRGTLTQ